MSWAPNDEGTSVVIACAAISTLRFSPCFFAKSSETRIAAAPPHVGGHAMSRVSTPGQSAGESITSCAVTSFLKRASGFFVA